MGGLIENQVAVVFGSTGNVGSVIAEVLSKQGAKVVVHYNHSEKLARNIVTKIESAGGVAVAIQADVTDKETVELLMKKVVNSFGAINIVVNTVHRDADNKLVYEMKWADWDVHLEALKGHFYICNSVLPYMRKQNYGRIVYISGGLSNRFFRGCSAYTTIKAGLNGFCKTLALEEGEHNITVNIVAPGKVISKSGKSDDINTLKEMEREQISRSALKRFATADDVANAVLYFVSPGSSCITGQTIFVTGGEIIL